MAADQEKSTPANETRPKAVTRDEVGRSGIYPASADDAPKDAQVRTPGEYVHHSKDESTVAEDSGNIGAERLPRKGDDEL